MISARADGTTGRPRWLSASLAVVPVLFLAVFYAWPVATL